MNKLISIKITLAFLCIFVITDNCSAKSPLGRSWNSSKLVSMESIDHSSYNTLLQKYVDNNGYVNYKGWKASSKDRRSLQNYLSHLSQASRSKRANKNARLAFWINAYNAVSLEGIMQVYPTSSIRNHTAKVFGYNIWQDLYLIVGKDQFSLEQIEHNILRKMKEPRIHFAIVCASVGCPRLMNTAYTTSNVQKNLKINTIDFLSRKQNFRVNNSKKTIHVSSILDWFKEDFGSTQASRFNYLKPYIPKEYQAMATNPRATVYYLKYNWNLNAQ